jgi:hypothetical protein
MSGATADWADDIVQAGQAGVMGAARLTGDHVLSVG